MESEKGEIQDRQIIFEIIDNLLKKEGMTEERAQAILNVSAAILPELALITKAYVMGMKASNKQEVRGMEKNKQISERKVAELEGQAQEQPSVRVDYPGVNLKKLTITNDKRIYEDMKIGKKIGIAFDPIAFRKAGFNDNDEIYIIGILQDK